MSSQFSPIQTQKEYYDEKETEFIRSHGEVPPPTPMLIRVLPMLENYDFTLDLSEPNE